MKNVCRFTRFIVCKNTADGSKSELVATFLTHYGARRFVLSMLARNRSARDFRWEIRIFRSAMSQTRGRAPPRRPVGPVGTTPQHSVSELRAKLKEVWSMCGIVGYVGNKQVVPVILEGLDRLTHHVYILEVNGESYRLEESKRKRPQKPASRI